MKTTPSIVDVMDIVGIICTYLNNKDKLKFLSISNYIYTNSKCFRYLKLNHQSSQLFYNNDITLCSRIQSLINSNRQLSLNLSCCAGVTDVSALSNVHTLVLSGCSGVTDVSALSNVHTLNLYG